MELINLLAATSLWSVTEPVAAADVAEHTLDYGDPERFAELLPAQATAAFGQMRLYHTIAKLGAQAGWQLCTSELVAALPYQRLRPQRLA